MEEHPQARHIIDTLTKNGFIAYYAGGWVRDYLLQHPSDDIDIATSAPPETIQALFPHTVPIGLAFGIILVIIDSHEYEVATFRQDLDYQDGRRPSKIAFSSAEEDAKRRDFTINGMFYDPLTNTILDYVEGKQDLQKKIIRAIGNPHDRIREDRLRMVRAIRLSCRFRFVIEKNTQDAIYAHAKELFPAVAIERIIQELEKAHNFQNLPQMLLELHKFGLLASIFPKLSNTSFETVQTHLNPTFAYPKNAPVIAFLLPLFPEASLKEEQAICKSLKLTNLDDSFVSFLHDAKTLAYRDSTSSVEDYDWAHLYASPFAQNALAILAAHNLLSLTHHAQKQQKLQKAVERIRSKTPVVTADFLMSQGVAPGPSMGKLLKAAEKIAINENLDDPTSILKKLL